MKENNMEEKCFQVVKVDGGFIIETESRKIVRKLSEVIALLKETMKDEPVTPE